jgi:hypothetical protein
MKCYHPHLYVFVGSGLDTHKRYFKKLLRTTVTGHQLSRDINAFNMGI